MIKKSNCCPYCDYVPEDKLVQFTPNWALSGCIDQMETKCPDCEWKGSFAHLRREHVCKNKLDGEVITDEDEVTSEAGDEDGIIAIEDISTIDILFHLHNSLAISFIMEKSSDLQQLMNHGIDIFSKGTESTIQYDRKETHQLFMQHYARHFKLENKQLVRKDPTNHVSISPVPRPSLMFSSTIHTDAVHS